MNNKKTYVALIVVAIIAIFGYKYPQSVETISVDKIVAEVKSQVKNFGISAGPESTNDFQCYSGICIHYRKTRFNVATGTPCVLRSPAATSTLDYASWGNIVGTSTAATIRMATSTTPYATTTTYETFSIPANTQTYWSWFGTTTIASGMESGIFAPNTYLVFGAEGSSVGGFTFGGSCQAEFKTF